MKPYSQIKTFVDSLIHHTGHTFFILAVVMSPEETFKMNNSRYLDTKGTKITSNAFSSEK